MLENVYDGYQNVYTNVKVWRITTTLERGLHIVRR